MPIFRKKAGPEFEAMEFDGSFESAKSIMAWMGDGYDAQGAYWSSNNTMTLPWGAPDSQNYMSGDWVTKRPAGLYRICAEASHDYEAVA